MLSSLLPERSLYSRNLMPVLLGMDVPCWIIVYVSTQICPLVMLSKIYWIVSALLWIATIRLITSYSPYLVKRPHQTYWAVLVHSTSAVLVFSLVSRQSFTALYVSLKFHFLRAATLPSIRCIYIYWKSCTNDSIRFITVGEASIYQILAEHLVGNGAKWLEHVSFERELKELIAKVQKIHQNQRIPHIYYTSSDFQYYKADALWRWADHYYVYPHWVPIIQLGSKKHKLLNLQLVNV